MSENPPFTEEQQHYLAGFAVGSGLAAGAPRSEPKPTGPEAVHVEAQDRVLADGRKLSSEEKAKREKNPLDLWDEMEARAKAGEFPKGIDVFRAKFHGLFYVAPAQDSYMCRLRIPGGVLSSHQCRGIAAIAETYGGGYAHVTTRANLQIREIGPRDPLHVVTALADLGIITRGAGADNVRNITASPTAGIDPQELIDTRPLARRLHHHILNHRELYGLPRKFNIAYDGGGRVSALSETNDIAFGVVRLSEERATAQFPAGVYFRMGLGGITGHRDFARDAGVMLAPEQTIPVAAGVVRVFIKHGDRTDRTRARLKYLLDAWGIEEFVRRLRGELGFELPTLPVDRCEPPPPPDPWAHVGFHRQKQPGRQYLGVVLPVGKLTVAQMRDLATIADRYGSGTIRLTVWQNLLISDIADDDVEPVKAAIEDTGLHWQAHGVRAGLIACTGNAGCKYSASNTKAHAMAIAEHVEPRLQLDQPVNIHLTGCHHSCAQHYIGDIGLLGTQIQRGEETAEGYKLFVGGGYGVHQSIGRELYEGIASDELPQHVERLLRVYLKQRRDKDESFQQFTQRHEIAALRELVAQVPLDNTPRSLA